jgi:hypothetical protein
VDGASVEDDDAFFFLGNMRDLCGAVGETRQGSTTRLNGDLLWLVSGFERGSGARLK